MSLDVGSLSGKESHSMQMKQTWDLTCSQKWTPGSRQGQLQGSNGVYGKASASTWQTYSLHVRSKTHILLAQCMEKVLSENSNYKRFGLAWPGSQVQLNPSHCGLGGIECSEDEGRSADPQDGLTTTKRSFSPRKAGLRMLGRQEECGSSW